MIKNTFKNIISILLVAAMLVTMIPLIPVAIGKEEQSGNVAYAAGNVVKITSNKESNAEYASLDAVFNQYGYGKAYAECTSFSLTLLQDLTVSNSKFSFDEANMSTAMCYTQNASISVDLNGHTLTLSGNSAKINVANGNNLTITDSQGGGKITSNSSNNLFYMNGATLSINGGTFNYTAGGRFVDVQSSSTVNITGGLIITSNSKTVFSGSNDCALSITGGMFDSVSINIKNIWYSSLGNFVSTGYTVKTLTEGMDGYSDGARLQVVEAQVVEAKIGGTEYSSLAAAVEYANSNENSTIVLQSDVYLTEAIATRKNTTLDLNGYTISCFAESSTNWFVTGSTLTITDTSQDKDGGIVRAENCDDNYFLWVNSGGILNINEGYYDISIQVGSYGASFNVYGGYFSDNIMTDWGFTYNTRLYGGHFKGPKFGYYELTRFVGDGCAIEYNATNGQYPYSIKNTGKNAIKVLTNDDKDFELPTFYRINEKYYPNKLAENIVGIQLQGDVYAISSNELMFQNSLSYVFSGENREYEFDLNGHTLTLLSGAYFNITHGNKLTIKDSSLAKTGKIICLSTNTGYHSMISITQGGAGGALIIESGEFYSPSGGTQQNCLIYNMITNKENVVTINGGKFVSEISGWYALISDPTSKINITNGVFDIANAFVDTDDANITGGYFKVGSNFPQFESCIADGYEKKLISGGTYDGYYQIVPETLIASDGFYITFANSTATVHGFESAPTSVSVKAGDGTGSDVTPTTSADSITFTVSDDLYRIKFSYGGNNYTLHANCKTVDAVTTTDTSILESAITNANKYTGKTYETGSVNSIIKSNAEVTDIFGDSSAQESMLAKAETYDSNIGSYTDQMNVDGDLIDLQSAISAFECSVDAQLITLDSNAIKATSFGSGRVEDITINCYSGLVKDYDNDIEHTNLADGEYTVVVSATIDGLNVNKTYYVAIGDTAIDSIDADLAAKKAQWAEEAEPGGEVQPTTPIDLDDGNIGDFVTIEPAGNGQIAITPAAGVTVVRIAISSNGTDFMPLKKVTGKIDALGSNTYIKVLLRTGSQVKPFTTTDPVSVECTTPAVQVYSGAVAAYSRGTSPAFIAYADGNYASLSAALTAEASGETKVYYVQDGATLDKTTFGTGTYSFFFGESTVLHPQL